MIRAMSSSEPYLSHIERTANSSRESGLHTFEISSISRANSSIHLFHLQPRPEHNITHKPGQWIDLYLPGLMKPGGFTITSSPSTLSLPTGPYLELAVKRSPQNPAAEWLWRPESDILKQKVSIRVGGEFVWPPPGVELQSIRRAVFIAGGVGINPLMSMLSYLAEQKGKAASKMLHMKIVLLYSFRCGIGTNIHSEVLFLDRLAEVSQALGDEMEMKLFFTTGTREGFVPSKTTELSSLANLKIKRKRIEESDLLNALGETGERKGTVCYVCGVPSMTDHFVETLGTAKGMMESRVFSEKWW